MSSVNRDELHKLVDALPDQALASVERALSNLQTWPEIRRPMDELSRRIDAILAEREAPCTTLGSGNSRSTLGCMSTRLASAGVDAEGHGHAHASGMIRGTEFDIDLHRIFGQELQIERDIRVSRDKRNLVYALIIKGPDGTEARRETEFEMKGDPPSSANSL